MGKERISSLPRRWGPKLAGKPPSSQHRTVKSIVMPRGKAGVDRRPREYDQLSTQK